MFIFGVHTTIMKHVTFTKQSWFAFYSQLVSQWGNLVEKSKALLRIEGFLKLPILYTVKAPTYS